MNKGNGGKQHQQWDTVIPPSNPVAEHQGKVQKMTLSDGCTKGLQIVLKEHGLNLMDAKKAKCSPLCPFKSEYCCMA
jgi:hypothetical protein